MSSVLIQDATIINEGMTFRGDLLIEGEIISAIGDLGQLKIQGGTEIINASGLFLIPGIIDDHVHFRDPGLTQKGDIFTETIAAASGGVTSFMDMPNTIPQTVTIDALKDKYILGSEKSLINYSFYIGATNNNLSEIMRADPQSVCGIKLFMGSSTGGMLVDNDNSLRDLFKNARMPICAHCEDESTISKNTESYRQKYGENIPFRLHSIIRSREACFLSSSRAVNLAKEYNARLHLLHVSTADEMKLLSNDATIERKRITGEACVHHLWFDESYYDLLGAMVKWNPSVKTRFDRDALVAGVRNDLIDVIATDHSPHTFEEKSSTYLKAPSGGPLVQHSLVAMLEFWHRKVFSLQKIVDKMCHNPALAFNIKDRGFIRVGYKADLCLFDPDSPWTVEKKNILYKCGWSPFEGTTFRSKVIATIVNGTPVYYKGAFKEDFRGQRLIFNRQNNTSV